jgi:hypothetical protein
MKHKAWLRVVAVKVKADVGGGRGRARGPAELPDFAVALEVLRVDVLCHIAKALKPPRWWR